MTGYAEKGNVNFSNLPNGATFRFPRYFPWDSDTVMKKVAYRTYEMTPYGGEFMMSTPNVMVMVPAT